MRQLEQSREDFIHIVFHDLRNPLQIISGQAQIIHRSAEKVNLVRKSAEGILTGARRMNVMIQDLADSARMEAGQVRLDKRPVQMRATVADLLERAREALDVARVKVEIP